MKSNTQKFFIGLTVAILALAVVACAFRFHKDGYEEGYKKGQASILEDWSDSDFIDYVVNRCGEEELLRYISQDGDAIIEFVNERYEPEDVPWVESAFREGLELGRDIVLEGWELSDYIEFLKDRYGSNGILEAMYSDNPLIFTMFVYDHYDIK